MITLLQIPHLEIKSAKVTLKKPNFLSTYGFSIAHKGVVASVELYSVAQLNGMRVNQVITHVNGEDVSQTNNAKNIAKLINADPKQAKLTLVSYSSPYMFTLSELRTWWKEATSQKEKSLLLFFSEGNVVAYDHRAKQVTVYIHRGAGQELQEFSFVIRRTTIPHNQPIDSLNRNVLANRNLMLPAVARSRHDSLTLYPQYHKTSDCVYEFSAFCSLNVATYCQHIQTCTSFPKKNTQVHALCTTLITLAKACSAASVAVPNYNLGNIAIEEDGSKAYLLYPENLIFTKTCFAANVKSIRLAAFAPFRKLTLERTNYYDTEINGMRKDPADQLQYLTTVMFFISMISFALDINKHWVTLLPAAPATTTPGNFLTAYHDAVLGALATLNKWQKWQANPVDPKDSPKSKLPELKFLTSESIILGRNKSKSKSKLPKSKLPELKFLTSESIILGRNKECKIRDTLFSRKTIKLHALTNELVAVTALSARTTPMFRYSVDHSWEDIPIVIPTDAKPEEELKRELKKAAIVGHGAEVALHVGKMAHYVYRIVSPQELPPDELVRPTYEEVAKAPVDTSIKTLLNDFAETEYRRLYTLVSTQAYRNSDISLLASFKDACVIK